MNPSLARIQTAPPVGTKWFGIASVALAVGYGFLIINSYPMMYPGYDIWWHLGVMQTGAAYDTSMTEYARWHRAWDGVLDHLGIQDIFERALIIHRLQFALTVTSIAAASFLTLLAAFRERRHKTLYILASFIAVGIWLSMHGTHSMARSGPLESAATQSWIMWYSVNYQISLPFYFLATAGTLCLVSGATPPGKAWLVGITTIVALVGLIYCHLAELPYYLFNLLLLAIVFGNRRQKLIFFVTFLFSLVLLQQITPYISHRIPELPKLLISGAYGEVLKKIEEYGYLQVHQGLNRAATSWNLLYTSSTVALGLAVLSVLLTESKQLASGRAIIFVLATGLLPLALFNQTTAGILSLITNPDLAWRFSFASFLYIGIPILLVLIVLRMREFGINKSNLILGASLIPLTAAPFTSETVRANTESIRQSLSPTSIHFGISQENKTALIKVSQLINTEMHPVSTCFDLFSTYYLYYVLGQKTICLPSSISSLPGAIDQSSTPSNCTCEFENKFNEFHNRGLPPPSWDFRFKVQQ